MKWLILRGLVREQRHWGDFPKNLEKEMKAVDPLAEVHMIDFPGFGTESDRPSPFSIEHIVDDVRQRWLEMRGESKEKAYLLAISLGGMVAMNWVSRYPADFAGLALINSSATGVSPIFKRLKPSNYPKILSLFVEGDIQARERKILEMTTNLAGEDLMRTARRQAEFAKPVRKKDAWAQIYSALRFSPPKTIGIPVLVLGAKGDRLVDYSCSLGIAERFKARLELHETGNHDLATDDGPWIVGRLRNWIETPSCS